MKQKVSAYITRNNSLLVFKHRDYPEAGIQILAGTIEDGETPEDAVMREAYEETGLTGLRLHCYLGSCKQALSKYGVAEIEQRYFFHLLCDEDCPATWSHAETQPSGGEKERNKSHGSHD